MTLNDAVVKALESGPGNPREITERLQGYVRNVLNSLADDGKIARRGYPGRGNEKTYSLKPHPKIERRL